MPFLKFLIAEARSPPMFGNFLVPKISTTTTTMMIQCQMLKPPIMVLRNYRVWVIQRTGCRTADSGMRSGISKGSLAGSVLLQPVAEIHDCVRNIAQSAFEDAPRGDAFAVHRLIGGIVDGQ